jgi:hypothetical protein
MCGANVFLQGRSFRACGLRSEDARFRLKSFDQSARGSCPKTGWPFGHRNRDERYDPENAECLWLEFAQATFHLALPSIELKHAFYCNTAIMRVSLGYRIQRAYRRSYDY